MDDGDQLGSSDGGEGDRESDSNLLATVILRQ